MSRLNSLQQTALGMFTAYGSCAKVAEEMKLSEITVRIILQTTVETLGVTSLAAAIVHQLPNQRQTDDEM
ncbi:MAG: hypothetical protein AAFY99_14455 [Pseudomonadota bacterium]